MIIYRSKEKWLLMGIWVVNTHITMAGPTVTWVTNLQSSMLEFSAQLAGTNPPTAFSVLC